MAELVLEPGARARFGVYHCLALIEVAELHERGLVDVPRVGRLAGGDVELTPHAKVGWQVLTRALT